LIIKFKTHISKKLSSISTSERKINECCLWLLDLFEGGGNDVMDGEGTVDGDGEDEGFGIDITDADSSFMGDVDADIIFCAQG